MKLTNKERKLVKEYAKKLQSKKLNETTMLDGEYYGEVTEPASNFIKLIKSLADYIYAISNNDKDTKLADQAHTLVERAQKLFLRSVTQSADEFKK